MSLTASSENFCQPRRQGDEIPAQRRLNFLSRTRERGIEGCPFLLSILRDIERLAILAISLDLRLDLFGMRSQPNDGRKVEQIRQIMASGDRANHLVRNALKDLRNVPHELDGRFQSTLPCP